MALSKRLRYEMVKELIARPNWVWTEEGRRIAISYAARLTQCYFEAVLVDH